MSLFEILPSSTNLLLYSEKDLLKARFIYLPSDVRQEISCRIFGTPFRYYGTKKSIYLAAIACFKPNSFHLKSVYSQAAYNKESEEKFLIESGDILDPHQQAKLGLFKQKMSFLECSLFVLFQDNLKNTKIIKIIMNK